MTEDNWDMVVGGRPAERHPAAAPLSSTIPLPRPWTPVAYAYVLKYAGATRPERDAIDTRIVGDVQNGTGGIIDSPADVGGWVTMWQGTPPSDQDHDGMPDDWETAHGLDPRNAADSAKDRNGDGYTNLEEYLNCLAAK